MPLRSLATALLLALAACQPEGPAPTATAPPGVPADALPDTATVQTVDPASTADLVGQAFGAISPSIAIQTIDRWTERIDSLSLEGDGEPEALAELRGDLVTLRRLLQSSPLDGPAIGRTLRALSATTADLAAPGSDLARLGRTLGAQADRLAPVPVSPDSAAARADDP